MRPKTNRIRKINGSLKRIFSPELKYVLVIFLITRAAMTPLIVESRAIGSETSRFVSVAYVNYAPNWLGAWGMWDSAWYLDIAKNWYSPEIKTDIWHYNQANYGFFPLYPLLMRLIGQAIGDYFIAGLIVSNVSLIIACLFMFKLASLQYDKATAYRAIKYMFLFPAAFMFSAVLTESLALALILASFYFAKSGGWLKAGVSGFLLALTKPYGALILIPLSFEYYKTYGLKVRPQAASLLLVPAGLFLFMCFTHILTGDFMAYPHIKESGWGHHLSNPATVLVEAITSGRASYVLNGLFSAAMILILLLNYRRMESSYLLFGLLFTLVPLANEGRGMLQCMTRYALIVFPLYITLALDTRRLLTDYCVTATLIPLQLILLYIWASGTYAI
ncbi:MAG: hypothetical protein V1875_04450 [Candidatus Altiarchaeota archaeon]